MSQKMGSKLVPFLVSSDLDFKPAAAWVGSRAWGAGGPSMASVLDMNSLATKRVLERVVG